MTIIEKILVFLMLLLMATIATYVINTQLKTPQIVQPELTIDNVIDNLDRNNINKVEYGKSTKFNDMRMIYITFKNEYHANSAEVIINKQIYQSHQFNNYFNLGNNAYAYLYNNKGQEILLLREGNKIMIVIGNNFGAELTKFMQTFSR